MGRSTSEDNDSVPVDREYGPRVPVVAGPASSFEMFSRREVSGPEMFSRREVSGPEGVAALALLVCGQASRSSGRDDSHSRSWDGWNDLLGSGGEPTGNSVQVPNIGSFSLGYHDSASNARSTSSSTSSRAGTSTKNDGTGGKIGAGGGTGGEGEGKDGAPGGAAAAANDPGPMPSHMPFERHHTSTRWTKSNKLGDNDQQRQHQGRFPHNSWERRINSNTPPGMSSYDRSAHARSSRHSGMGGRTRWRACPPGAIPGAGGVRRSWSRASSREPPMYKCPSFDPDRHVDHLLSSEEHWGVQPHYAAGGGRHDRAAVLLDGGGGGDGSRRWAPVGGIEIANSGASVGVGIDGGGVEQLPVPAYHRQSWTVAPARPVDVARNSAPGAAAVASNGASGGSAVNPSWVMRSGNETQDLVVNDNSHARKPSFDTLKMMIPGMESFTGGGAGRGVNSSTALGRTDATTPSPMAGYGPEVLASSSQACPLEGAVSNGGQRGGRMDSSGCMKGVNRTFGVVDVGRAGSEITALSGAGEMLTEKQKERQAALERYRRKKLRRPYVKAARDHDPARDQANKARERPRKRGKFVKKQADFVPITSLQARSDGHSTSGEGLGLIAVSGAGSGTNTAAAVAAGRMGATPEAAASAAAPVLWTRQAAAVQPEARQKDGDCRGDAGEVAGSDASGDTVDEASTKKLIR